LQSPPQLTVAFESTQPSQSERYRATGCCSAGEPKHRTRRRTAAAAAAAAATTIIDYQPINQPPAAGRPQSFDTARTCGAC